METQNGNLVGELNKLVVINIDRSEGYEKAMAEVDDADLKILFSKCSLQSKKFNSELQSEINKMGGKPEQGTTQSGKFYRAWMDIKSVLTGRDKKKILGSCEFGEDVARDTYKEVLADPKIPTAIHHLIRTQLGEISSAHDEVRRLRDSA
jgi:uncharacterized protein (TIGR02284 family)